MSDLVLKLAGAACIIGAAAAYGESRARALEQRVRQLQQLQLSLKLFSAEISYAQSLLPAAFMNICGQCDPPVRDLYARAAEILSKGLDGPGFTAREAWEKALKQVGPKTCFTAADREIIKNMGVSLGVAQQEGQLQQIRLAEQHLAFALEGARENRDRHARLWRYLGALGGAALVILLL